MTCKSKVQKINNTLTGNKQKLFLKPPRSLPASVMKRKQSQEFVLRMPLKMGCLKIAKVELWQKYKKIKNSKQTQKRLCVKSDCVTVELLSVRYQNPSTLKKCILLIVISIRCSIFTVQNLTKEAVSAFVSWGVGGGGLYSSAQFNSGLETVFVWFLRHYIQFESQMRWCLLSGLKIFSWGRSHRCCLANS